MSKLLKSQMNSQGSQMVLSKNSPIHLDITSTSQPAKQYKQTFPPVLPQLTQSGKRSSPPPTHRTIKKNPRQLSLTHLLFFFPKRHPHQCCVSLLHTTRRPPGLPVLGSDFSSRGEITRNPLANEKFGGIFTLCTRHLENEIIFQMAGTALKGLV